MSAKGTEPNPLKTTCAMQGCQREALIEPADESKCILHSPNPKKDLDVFEAEIRKIIDSAPQNKNSCDFSYVNFPERFACHILRDSLKFSVDFFHAQFSGDVDFHGMGEVSSKVNFSRAKFSAYATFHSTCFSEFVNFKWSQFIGDADFTGVEFSDGASFSVAQFSARADFYRTKFLALTDFSDAKFLAYTHFYSIGCADSAKIFFWYVVLKEPSLVKIHSCNLWNWSFLDTDLRSIDFDNVTFQPFDLQKTTYPQDKRIALYDETQLTYVKFRSEEVSKVERLYRHLKLNFEANNDYALAGKFYYGEMEMKRIRLGSKKGILRFMGVHFEIYKFLSGYGEQPLRAFGILMVLIGIFGVLFMFAGYNNKDMNFSVHRELSLDLAQLPFTAFDWFKSVLYAAQSLTIFKQPNITFLDIWGEVAHFAATILGALQFGLFALALQRQFKR